MKPDGRNLTPLRALSLLRGLDQLQDTTRNIYAVQDARRALAEYVSYGLSKARRRKARK